MFKKILFFIKYNNAVVLILAIIFVAGTGVFAASEPGQEIIGQKETEISGTDNTLLLSADLDALDMDYKIEKIEEDADYFFVTYTCLELIKKDNAWQYQLNEKNRKISKKIKKDLGVYLAEELKEEYEAKIKDLKIAKTKAQTEGESVRQEVSAYSGLIGKTLGLAAKVFEGYEPVKKVELPSPTIPPAIISRTFEVESETEQTDAETERISPADNLTEIINNYMDEKDPDGDGYVGVLDNCPNVSNIDQADANQNGIGDVCEVVEEQIISNEEQIVSEIEQGAGDDSETANDNIEPSEDVNTEIVEDDYETVEVVEIK
ncbi:MAG: hypothetical protein US83_C0003G0047 [Candidatus Falkowbacteria bacterium GW2011_GWC2_38_22]|uniref:Uncharacterized protein n=1 Tax=Candidatus Falkowbacteria bacterium GW2011_GWE1_38_31 TaxID=1618638 RepID=A0A0G0JXB3_9BACT|nr:MAG: hypothetical protein US73_C0001G0139 [Candidatus Falkowbacteria bacterium GW2011_GWF2_38_1205]KKQ61798.1 MAG: hypothetical protein US83_C0003G0047 [Candidatus Falkowbacteria bacterium GW2011_GWC2_38_22]KKQ64106.1 MAG: hypothetical protein US84_C0002G0138 [Candidatus Falkowbacteria bacterium GW2011_GWF1_38_22]KKQ66544.1 MAG: hypothetical protein US87_C0001G0065 [Candidatus Falkowbacteria bacterium GW2011_GWE2_38_254]KKQ71212.1 MAG: hypothetical protein US91_C0001G0139 [Candidatus Falkowb